METSEEFRTATDEASEAGESSTDGGGPAADAGFDAPTGSDVSAPAEAGIDRLSDTDEVEGGGDTADALELETDEDDLDADAELDEDAFVAPSGDVDEAEPPVEDEAPLDREADLPVDDDS